MEKATIYLHTPMFSFAGPDAHIPPAALVVEGTILDRPSGAITVQTTRFMDERGRELSTASLRIQLPWSKIDHVHLHEG